MEEQDNVFFIGERFKFAKGKGLPEEMEEHYGTIVGTKGGKAVVKDTTYKGNETFYVEKEQIEHTLTNLYFLDMFEKLGKVTNDLTDCIQELKDKLDEHITKTLTVTEIAKQAGVSRQTIYNTRKKLRRTPTIEEIIEKKQNKKRGK